MLALEGGGVPIVFTLPTEGDSEAYGAAIALSATSSISSFSWSCIVRTWVIHVRRMLIICLVVLEMIVRERIQNLKLGYLQRDHNSHLYLEPILPGPLYTCNHSPGQA